MVEKYGPRLGGGLILTKQIKNAKNLCGCKFKSKGKNVKILKIKRAYDGYLAVDILETPQKQWEVVRAKPAVVLFLLNKSNNCALFVRQWRASMVSRENPSGILVEAIAGRLDKPGLSVLEIASSEAHEEAGVIISPQRIQYLNYGKPLASSAGMTDERIYLTYGEITNNDIDPKKTRFGASGEGEEILGRLYIPVSDLKMQAWDNMHTALLVEKFLRAKRRNEEGGEW